MQFSETCSRQSLIFSSPKYNYVSMCIVMQKKIKKSHKQKIKCYGFDCEIFENARKIFQFCVVVLAHLYCSQVLETQLDVSEIQFWWFSFFLLLKSDLWIKS